VTVQGENKHQVPVHQNFPFGFALPVLLKFIEMNMRGIMYRIARMMLNRYGINVCRKKRII